MSFIIGIDAGGTKTKCLILNKDKEVLLEIQSGYGNPNVNYEQALSHLEDVIAQCLQSRFGAEIKGVIAGVAGIEAGSNKERLNNDLNSKFKLPVVLLNDAELAYYAVLNGENGVLTIAGTGSVSYGKYGEQEYYTGGWGHLLGDEGSAYDVAVQACKKMIREADEGRNASALSKSVMAWLKIEDVTGIKGFVYQAAKGEIASLSLIVYEEAKAGNEEALGILSNAGELLAVQTSRLLRKLNASEPFLIGCKGSLLENNEFVFEAFKNKVIEMAGSSEFVVSQESPAVGAVIMAKSMGWL